MSANADTLSFIRIRYATLDKKAAYISSCIVDSSMPIRQRHANIDDLGRPLESQKLKEFKPREDVHALLAKLNSKRGADEARRYLASGMNEDMRLEGTRRFTATDFARARYDRKEGFIYFQDGGFPDVCPEFEAFSRKLEGDWYPKGQKPRGYIYGPEEGPMRGASLLLVNDRRDREIIDHEKAHETDPNLYHRRGHNNALGEMIVDLSPQGERDWERIEGRIMSKYIGVWTSEYSPRTRAKAQGDVKAMIDNCRRLGEGEPGSPTIELLRQSLTVSQFNETAEQVIEGKMVMKEAVAKNMRDTNQRLLRRR